MSAENVIDRLLPWNRIDSDIKKLVETTSGPLCIGCSGGPDSMALFLLVRYYWKNRRCILLHYNHRIREASEIEEAELKRFAEQQNIKIEIGHRSEDIGKTEGDLREARYGFFRKMMRLHGASLLFLGHHQDDLFETVLMRLVRGSSLEGLIAPRTVHKTPYYIKVRPLLNFSKKELMAVCNSLGMPYFTDSTNDSDDYLRNRIRHHVLGKFDSVFRGIHWRKGFAETCRILAMHRNFLKTQEARFLTENKLSTSSGACEFYCECALPEKRILLEKWFEKQKVNVRFELMDQIWDKWNSGENFAINLDAMRSLKCEDGRLTLLKRESAHRYTFHLSWQCGTVFMPNGYTLKIKREAFSQDLYEKLMGKQWDQTCAFVGDAGRLQDPLWVRDWRPGDAYCPLGKSHAKKVKELFLAQGITGERKYSLPVICDKNGAIAWIPGLPPADAFKVTRGTKMCIFLFYRKA